MSTDKFVSRHNGPRENEVKEMLKKNWRFKFERIN
jgi:hypothetical protein